MTKKEAPQKDSKSRKETKKKDIKSKVTDQIDALKKEIEQEKDKYLRLFAEFENFKKNYKQILNMIIMN